MAETASLKRPHEDTEETKETTNGSERLEETQKNGESEKNGETEKNGTNGTSQAEAETKSEADEVVESDSYNFFASSKRSKKGLSMEQDAMRRLGMQLTAPDFTNEDMKLPPWTDISRKLYREKKTLHDTRKASQWMRWWFKEHEGMPSPPTRSLQSAFVLWQQEKMASGNIKMSDKKERKRLGAEWKKLSEEEQVKNRRTIRERITKFDKLT